MLTRETRSITAASHRYSEVVPLAGRGIGNPAHRALLVLHRLQLDRVENEVWRMPVVTAR